VNIGEDPEDPIFTINDLLPHLGKDQMKKDARTVIEGEQLNILAGSIPFKFKPEANAVKLNILNFLHEKYGIVEEDFVSAELQVVPAEKARDVGFDRSFIGAYGQDDRICSYLGMKALFDTKKSDKNLLMVFFDKEEIGSKGNAGANSNIVERMINDIMQHYGKGDYNTLIKALENSKLLSADVNGGVDPERGVHGEKCGAAVYDIHSVFGEIHGNCATAALVHFSKFGNLPKSFFFVKRFSALCNKLCVSFIGVILSAGACEFCKAYAITDFRSIHLLIYICPLRIYSAVDIG